MFIYEHLYLGIDVAELIVRNLKVMLSKLIVGRLLSILAFS